MNTLLARIKPWLYPSLIGTYHDRPLPFSIGNVPTVGESFYIAVLLILNIVFLTVGYETLWPREEMQWYENHYQELMAYWMWRTGALAFCQMPILFLFSTRNNLLLWLTNWSHSTFMLLHRWIARFFLLQVLLHSIISLVLYIDTGAYATELGTPLVSTFVFQAGDLSKWSPRGLLSPRESIAAHLKHANPPVRSC